MSTRPYVVKQGDYLTRLAFDMGFDAEEVWQNKQNEELREQRAHWDILAPGDVLHVPEPSPQEHSIASGFVNLYRGRPPRLPVHLVLMDGAKPVADAQCLIVGLDSSQVERHTDANGRLSLSVPLHVRELRLVLPEKELEFLVLLGHMDPITEPSGVRARLANLGYRGVSDDNVGAEWNEPGLVYALSAFQRDQHLEVTGTLDDATRDALQERYGT